VSPLPAVPLRVLPAGADSPGALARAAKDLARENGFDLAGIAPPHLGEAYGRYRDWLARGHHGAMAYMARTPEAREDLRRLWPETRSALVVAMRYQPPDAPAGGEASPPLPRGIIAGYAQGGDYHKFMKKRLMRVLRSLKEIAPEIEGRSYVDTGPVLERDLAVLCGLGWKAKNSLLLNRELGSYFFLGTLLLNAGLPPDAPFEEDHCGTCTRCIEACPTGAIVAPGVLDARLCISYLTIELRGPMPRELRPLVGGHVFGCDICQEVCPWNEEAPPAAEPRFLPRPGARRPELLGLLELGEGAFRERFLGTAVMRCRYDGFLRNAAVAVGNTAGAEALQPLARALKHAEPMARGHAAWAMGRIGRRLRSDWARLILEGRLHSERDEWVREEIELALGELAAAWQTSGDDNQGRNGN